MISSASNHKKIGWRREENSLFVTLPYGNVPSPGQFFGPPTIGGPPGSRTPRRELPSASPSSVELEAKDSQSGFDPSSRQFHIHGKTTTPSNEDSLSLHTTSYSGSRWSEQYLSQHSTDEHDEEMYDENADDAEDEQRSGDEEEEEEEEEEEQMVMINYIQEQNENAFKETSEGHPGAPGQQMAPWRPGQGAPHQWDNMPQQPLPQGQGQGPPQFGPPPQGYMQPMQGYGGVGGFGQMSPMPPPPPPPPPSGTPPDMQFGMTAAVDEQACREAMLQFVSENCCYGKGPAKEHQVDNIKPSNALHYTLETFTEHRSTGYIHEAFRGQMIDGPENGMPPGPWQIPCVANSMFNTHDKKLEVPHTATIKPCHACDGRGFNRCWHCDGMGHNRCNRCHGQGRVQRHDAEGHEHWDNCFTCHGDGRERCHQCGGDGRITCDICDGYRQLKCYIQLTVKFVNHKEDHILEKTDMPDELVREVGGDLIFEQVLPQVWPIIAFPVPDINQNSVRLVEKHRGQWPNERSLQQRQKLRSVSVTEVECTWKESKLRYWVYGQERKVHCPDYPQTCCWGCTIM